VLWQHIIYLCVRFCGAQRYVSPHNSVHQKQLAIASPHTSLHQKQLAIASPHTSVHHKQHTHNYIICCHNTHNNGIFIILTRDFSQELHMLPDDDMQCAIETCRSSESVLM
jgi:hypothetical protein